MERYGVHVVDADLLRRLVDSRLEDGIVLSRYGTHIVAVNPQKSSRRSRFTFAHETGHVALLHPDEFDILGLLDACRTDMSANRTLWALDREADLFAAEVLMPLGLVKHLGMSADEVSLFFGVSKEAAKNRIADASLRSGRYEAFLCSETVDTLLEIYAEFAEELREWRSGQRRQVTRHLPRTSSLRRVEGA